MQLSQKEYKLISGLIYDKFGISLNEQKQTLITGRLQNVLHQGGFTSFKDYYRYVVGETSGSALLTLIDRISTNHTYFFREKDHFDFIKDTLLPQTIKPFEKNGEKELKIWCAGCSSGEEPYTAAMVILENISRGSVFNILATDISVSSLDKAIRGTYAKEQLETVPPSYRQKYFVSAGDGVWTIHQKLKNKVLFRRLNLIQDSYPFKGKFDVIFCRNVMIYFDSPTRRALLERFHRYLEPDGYLFTGHTETVDRSLGIFRYVKPAVYQKI
ncbi:MAG: protein-glutamate O-methyltransferase [Eubacteriales bacterium]